MQIVESFLRPPRIALALREDASNRVMRRVFRLLGGKWGGVYDVAVLFDASGSLPQFWRDLLVSADPDYIAVVDPNLSLASVERVIGELRLQPFKVDRLKERQEGRTPWRTIFRELPTPAGSRSQRQRVLDHDQGDVDWRVIARTGLPSRLGKFERVKPGEITDTVPPYPITIGRLGIGGRPRVGAKWLLIGRTNDPAMGCRFWSLRAIGRAPAWHREDAIENKKLRIPGNRIIVFAPEATSEDLEDAVARWSTSRKQVLAAKDDQPQRFPRMRVYIASHTETVAPYDGFWRISFPSPPALEEDYANAARCVAEFNLMSPNPDDPDGIVLAPTEVSREIISGGLDFPPKRITRRGVAQLTQFSRSSLVAIPHINYREAVDAALAEFGFNVTPSDKGLYQQRSLQLAKGLRFLAWILRQPESRMLLRIFFEYHLQGKPPPKYRRAVRYEELKTLLLENLREARGGKLRASWRERGEEWLKYWVNGLLDRGLLIGGHVLRCPVCADRSFYRLESLGQSFECRRCMATSSMPGDTPRCFQLNEAIFQLLEHDGEVTTLTLAALRESAELSFLYLPEIIVNRDGLTRELDIAALADGELVIGEVKSKNKLTKKEVTNSRLVAKHARAGRMLFATTMKQQGHCAAGECGACQHKYGQHHADMAWKPEVRKEIQKTRALLEPLGTRVESFCWYSLIGRYREKHQPLARFERYG